MRYAKPLITDVEFLEQNPQYAHHFPDLGYDNFSGSYHWNVWRADRIDIPVSDRERVLGMIQLDHEMKDSVIAELDEYMEIYHGEFWMELELPAPEPVKERINWKRILLMIGVIAIFIPLAYNIFKKSKQKVLA